MYAAAIVLPLTLAIMTARRNGSRLASTLFVSLLVWFLVVVEECHSFSVSFQPKNRFPRLVLSATQDDGNGASGGTMTSRRTVCSQAVGLFTMLTTSVEPVMANNSQEVADKAKLYKGYESLNYLLDNWVKETTVCGVSDNPYISAGGCERTPLKVMDYLGYKDVNAPLFKADKTMRRLEDLVPSNRQVEYLEAIEKYQEAAEEGNGMAYISSWGEVSDM